jgi:nucleoside phosphorylase
MEYQRLSPLDYTVGWFSALPLELAAAALLLDESHPAPPSEFDDGQLYRFGRIGSHNVVMGCLPAGRTGLASAASAATRMSSTFGNLRVCLMVGIGGGVPSKKNDVRLGDVVVSQPRGGHGGVIQYDMGKVMPGGFYHTGPVNAPPEKLLQALAHLQVSHILEGNGIAAHLAIIERKETFQRPSAKSDVLFKPTYDHRAGERSCDRCDRSQIIRRNDRRHNGIEIHYGNIASGSCVMKDARVRDALSDQFKGVLCFEMEAAGLLNHWPCLVIRGISDYADSHKNDDWQGYAAGAAAAYARELLLSVKSSVQDQEPAAAIPLRVVGGALSGRSFQGSSVLPAHRIGTGRPGQGRQGHLEQNGFQRRLFSEETAAYDGLLTDIPCRPKPKERVFQCRAPRD